MSLYSITPKPKVSKQTIKQTFALLQEELQKRLEQKGDGIFVTPHETLGVVTEEYFELVEAIRTNDDEETVKELFDLTVASFFGVISLMTQNKEVFNEPTEKSV